MEAGIPAYLTQVAHLPVNVIGIVFFFNTLVIVVVQGHDARAIEQPNVRQAVTSGEAIGIL